MTTYKITIKRQFADQHEDYVEAFGYDSTTLEAVMSIVAGMKGNALSSEVVSINPVYHKKEG